jgi:hypothetical protein
VGIKDRKRFAELDALIRAGYGDMKQEDIPGEVLDAAEEGIEIAQRGPARDVRWARAVEEPPARPPAPHSPGVRKKRVMTQEQRDRKNARNRAQWNYRPALR